ncbi:hypothetical protein HPP92_024400 [Vanilla planifolia]|uniref:Uncharacterized protein n=1 Tax=Vanilla planifolia TaxID=51239 RepID=A0A835PV28_VANPL|nr:hypothetical protein HPP92_024400 [Vanilla planifolia]
MEASVSGEDSGDYGCGIGTLHIADLMERVGSIDEECRIEAAREIRWLTKASSKNRRQLAGAVEPLVSMLRLGSQEAAEVAMFALLNLAVKDERRFGDSILVCTDPTIDWKQSYQDLEIVNLVNF